MSVLKLSQINGGTPVMYNPSTDVAVGVRSGTTDELLDISGITLKIGNAVSGGTAKSVLYIDGSGNLAQDANNFSYDSSAGGLTVSQKVDGFGSGFVTISTGGTHGAFNAVQGGDGNSYLKNTSASGSILFLNGSGTLLTLSSGGNLTILGTFNLTTWDHYITWNNDSNWGMNVHNSGSTYQTEQRHAASLAGGTGTGWRVVDSNNAAMGLHVGANALVAVNQTTSYNNIAQFTVYNGSASRIGQVIQLAATPTAAAWQVQSSTGSAIVAFYADGSLNSNSKSFLYDQSGALGNFGTHMTLYIGDVLNDTYDGVLALYDEVNGNYLPLSPFNGQWNFGAGTDTPGGHTGTIACGTLKATTLNVTTLSGSFLSLGNVNSADSTAYVGLGEDVVNGSISGTATFSQPFSTPPGGAFHALGMVMILLSSLNGTASYTFPEAFTHTPVTLSTSGLATTIVTSLSTTAVTVTGTTTSGIIIIAGY